jgi:hypothetical protein
VPDPDRAKKLVGLPILPTANLMENHVGVGGGGRPGAPDTIRSASPVHIYEARRIAKELALPFSRWKSLVGCATLPLLRMTAVALEASVVSGL